MARHRSRRPDFGSSLIEAAIVGVIGLMCISMTSSVAKAFEPPDPLERDDCQRLFFPLPESSPRNADLAIRLLAVAQQQGENGEPWQAFHTLWRAHHADPANERIRQALALPSGNDSLVSIRPGRRAPPQLRLRRGRYMEAETPHFIVFSTASRQQTITIAEDLERFYWIWSQVFFPLWEDRNGISRALAGTGGLAAGKRRLQVVLCEDRDAYNRMLVPFVPGIEQSTGFYSDSLQATFLFAGMPADPATRYHELTHQLLREATGARLRGGRVPGDHHDFWLVEGVATYMESLRFAPTYALVGGWESPRLQYARYRWLVGGDREQLQQLLAEGRRAVQQRDDLARWYSHVAAYTHWFFDGGQADGRAAVFSRLTELYEIPRFPDAAMQQPPATLDVQQASEEMETFLRLSDERLHPPDPQIPLQSLCLGRTAVTADGLRQIPPQPALQWLDLSHLPVGNDDLRRIAPQAGSLAQLNLEATQIDDELGAWLAAAENVVELDLSLTSVSDRLIAQLPTEWPLQTLWLTGTNVSDAVVDRAAMWSKLEAIDVQKTKVTPSAVDRLRQARPDLTVNPLQLITDP